MATLADLLRQREEGDAIRATPQNAFGPLSNAVSGGVEWLRSPLRTQQMQGLGALLESTGIPKTLERISYGEPLTNINQANVPLMKPETAEAIMNVAPFAGPAAKGFGKLAGEAINDAMVYGRGPLAKITPQPMRITAWHGSGKLFPEFDVTRTPEQGYAYTRGSYAAAAKREAENKYMPRDLGYEEKLMDLYKKAEKSQDYDSMEVLESAMVHQTPKDLRENFINSGDYDEKFAKKASGLIDKIETFPKESYLYKLDVKDEALPKMLQYDNPISQQSDEVKALAKELGVPETDLGGDIVGKLLANKVEGLDIQNTMRGKGIPGLIYNSPDVQGSVNYVAYDPELYKILEINDKPYEQWFSKDQLANALRGQK